MRIGIFFRIGGLVALVALRELVVCIGRIGSIQTISYIKSFWRIGSFKELVRRIDSIKELVWRIGRIEIGWEN